VSIHYPIRSRGDMLGANRCTGEVVVLMLGRGAVRSRSPGVRRGLGWRMLSTGPVMILGGEGLSTAGDMKL
jgi:hypothetical protein